MFYILTYVVPSANSPIPPSFNFMNTSVTSSTTTLSDDIDTDKHEVKGKIPQHFASPYTVTAKYPQLTTLSKISTLAVKLARECYFGKDLMKSCTVRGTREHDGLPADKLEDMKSFLQYLFPKCSQPEFERAWKNCVDAIGQCCNALRKK